MDIRVGCVLHKSEELKIYSRPKTRRETERLTNHWRLIDLISILVSHTRKNFVNLLVSPLSPALLLLHLISTWRLTDETIDNLFRIDLSRAREELKVSDWLTANHVSVNPATWCVRFVGSREIDAFLSMRTTYSCLCDLFVFSHLSTKLYIFHLFFNSIQSTCLDDSLRLSGKRIWSCDCISWCRT